MGRRTDPPTVRPSYVQDPHRNEKIAFAGFDVVCRRHCGSFRFFSESFHALILRCVRCGSSWHGCSHIFLKER